MVLFSDLYCRSKYNSLFNRCKLKLNYFCISILKYILLKNKQQKQTIVLKKKNVKNCIFNILQIFNCLKTISEIT